ncbi:hypothetical protein [Pelagibacterium halotolerans]|uniref:Uncharacterized protein n=1 Tax=Pelagibacterium halotolerans (strain DSM 22347 / JCM 15775 / CGMCC 1.7692 / B2) TaxID=1082931 RepID=G4RGT1_PELHB|nr:hypothetical protein [Pelagibacterium halotolerans]AEQ52120.1 hypothetical protein KKY_2111 [Pelagibacterium halotolerans B2]QJR18111.1 hypothetical protein HKM20_06465 [Pelagibacterium halotolerans]SDZ83954.1 hypothetical protein SAMN05428936_101183 [Pelagibacterium halotolerans]
MDERERETVVVTNGGGGGGGLIFAVIIALVVVVGVIYFVNVNSGGTGGTVSVDVPAVDVTE